MRTNNLSAAVVEGSLISTLNLSADINASIRYHAKGVEKLSNDISLILNDISNVNALLAGIRTKISHANGLGVKHEQAKLKAIIESDLNPLTSELSTARYNKQVQEKLLAEALQVKASRIEGAYMIKRDPANEVKVQQVRAIIQRKTTIPVKPFIGIRFSLTDPDYQGWKRHATAEIKIKLFC